MEEFRIVLADACKIVKESSRKHVISGADEDGRVMVEFSEPVSGRVVKSLTPEEINGMLYKEETAENPADMTEENPTGEQDTEQERGTTEESAFERIPKDEEGNPQYTQTDAPTAWDAIVEQTEGDEDMARSVVDSTVRDKEAALKKLESSNPKPGATVAEKIAAAKEHKAAIEVARQELEQWKAIVEVENRRKAEEKEKVVSSVPAVGNDISNDTVEVQSQPEVGNSMSGNSSEATSSTDKVSESSKTKQGKDVETGVKLSDEIDENGKPLVLAKDGTTTFGIMEPESGLREAPIQLSLGENYVGEDGKNHGYGLLHIEAGHGKQIRSAGFPSVEEFVEEVAKNYVDIREGAKIGNTQTYLLEMTDDHNNTLFVQLSKDGTYWNVNSAGIFNVKYSRRKPKVYSVPALGEDINTDTSEVDSDHSKGVAAPAGNSSKTSASKVSESPETKQEKSENSISAKVKEASADVNTEPTEAQKEAGNYKKGHVQVGTFDITIEQPEGSIRRGTDANGKQWESKMHNTYGYFRGTEGVDGDHIDVFLSNDMDGWNGAQVFVVDQYNPDGTFDEHKVMLGFNDASDAKNNYLANYKKGWEKGRRIDVSVVSLADFEKWIASSHRKTKPFSEYKSVKPADDSETFKGHKVENSGKEALEDVIGRSLNADETHRLIAFMENTAESAPELELTPQNWAKEFGESGVVSTPIGEVKQGDNQYLKLAQQGRNGKLGMIKPTLEHPSVIIEDERASRDGNTERGTSYVFIKTFVKKDGSRYYHFASITVSKEGKEVVISSQERSTNRISKLLQQGKVTWIDREFSLHPTAQIEKSVPLNDSNKPTSTDSQPALLGINSSELNASEGAQKRTTSTGKVSESPETKQEKTKNSISARVKEAKSKSAPDVKRQQMRQSQNEPQNIEVQIKHLEEIKDYPGADKKIVQSEIDRLKAKEEAKAKSKSEEVKSKSKEENGVDDAKIDAVLEALSKGDEKAEQLVQGLTSRELSKLRSKVKVSPLLENEWLHRVRTRGDVSLHDWMLENQYVEPVKRVSGTFKMTDYIAPKDSPYAERLGGVYHDKSGFAVATDGRILVASKDDFDPKLKGKVIGKDGTVSGSKFPDGQKIIPAAKETKSSRIDAEDLHRFVAGVLKADKHAYISLRFPDGTTVAFEADKLNLMLRAMKRLGADKLLYMDVFRDGIRLVAKSEKGTALLMGLVSVEDELVEANGYAYPGNTVSYQRGEVVGETSQEERVLRDAVIDRLRESGMEVITDEEAGQRVLDEANGKVRQMSFGEPYDYAAYPYGRVEPNLAEKEVNVVAADANHGFNNYKEAKTWAKQNVSKSYNDKETGGKGNVRISNAAIDKFLSQSAVDKSDSKDVHMAVLKVLPGLLKTSIDVETHPDFIKGEDGKRNAENGINKDVLVHRCYGAVSLDGKLYRVKITLKEDPRDLSFPHITHSYEATKIELLAGTWENRKSPSPNTSNSITAAKLLENVGMSYNPGEKVLAASEKRSANIREQRVYHGSGADFDRFDHSHIGEGEGNQAFGWGTYVTEVEGIGRTYAEQNAQDVSPTEEDFEMMNAAISEKVLERFGGIDTELRVDYDGDGGFNLLDVPNNKEVLVKFRKYFENHPDEFDGYIEDYDLDDEYGRRDFADAVSASMLDFARKVAEDYKDKYLPTKQRILYTVEIPDDTGENYLSWNEPLSKELVDKAAKALPSLNEFDIMRLKKNGTGEGLYRTVSMRLAEEEFNDDEKASKFLSSLGIVGIKYPADFMRGGREDGKNNYVIFNEKDAKITDRVRFFRTAKGEAYGFTVGGKIYVDPKIANTETPIHEYAHLWAAALRGQNPKEWQNIVELMKGTSVWDEVKKRYPELNTDDDIADEVLATYSGRRGAERLREEQRKIAGGKGGVFEKAEAISALERVKQALRKFWKSVADFLHIHYKSAEEVADRVMKDLLDGVDPGKHFNSRMDESKSERIEKLRESKPVEITGDEITPSDDLKQYKRNALEYGKKLRGVYTNEDTGEQIELTGGNRRGGLREILQHDYKDKEHLQSIAAIPQIIEKAIFIDELPNEDRKNYSGVRAFRYYVCGLKIADVDYTVKAVIAEQNNGERYYDHKLTKIEKGKLLSIIPTIQKAGMDSDLPRSVGKDSRLLSILQVKDEKKPNRELYRAGSKELRDGRKIEFVRKPTATYNALARHLQAEGIKPDMHEARTGSRYMSFEKDGVQWEVRSSDHTKPEYYGEAQKPVELTYYKDKQGEENLSVSVDLGTSGYNIEDMKALMAEIDRLKNDAGEVKESFYRGVASDEVMERYSLLSQALGVKSENEVRVEEEAREHAEEARKQEMRSAVEDMAGRLHLNNVDIVDKPAGRGAGRRERAKGMFERSTGRITINIGNCADKRDAVVTLLHEAVAHHGLRKLFGENFETFLDNVYNSANAEIRRIIDKHSRRYGGDKRTATEEYMASLAERTDFENAKKSGWWQRIKDFFLKMLEKIGLKGFKGEDLSDNELRYVLWRSYENLKSGGKDTVFSAADDLAKQSELNVGEFAPDAKKTARDAKKIAPDAKKTAPEENAEEVNERFNNELTRYQSGDMDKNEMLHLGKPQGVMKQFLPDLPIVVRQRILKKGSEKKHNIDVAALANMPRHLSSPIFVFQRSDNALGVLTEMQDRDGKNVCVAIELGREIQNGGEMLEVNDIRSVHGRNVADIVYPIVQNGTLKWADKEKGLAYLSSASRYVQQEIDRSDLSTAAKVVENFENPKSESKNDILFRDGAAKDYEKAQARETYERRVSTGMFQSREAIQDSMLSLKVAMDAIEEATAGKAKRIEDYDGFENAYLGENRLSSVNQAESAAFAHLLIRPMMEEVNRLAPTAEDRAELIDYMFAKHGLERNAYMRQQAAEKKLAEYKKQNPGTAKTAADFIDAERDYAGLTTLTGEADVSAAEAEAQRMVTEYEKDYTFHGTWNEIYVCRKKIC